MSRDYSVEELLKYAYDSLPVIVFAKDRECRYVFSSEVEPLIDGGEEHSILGKTDKEIQFDPKLGELYFHQDLELMDKRQPCSCVSEFWDGERRILREISKTPVYDGDEVIGVCGIVSDVTELVELKERFEALSMYDSLTGLYNRNCIVKFSGWEMERLPYAYMMCDCNNLKLINDTQGHEMGDQYIVATAELLREAIPDGAVAIRWGGDEFLIVIPECEELQCEHVVRQIESIQREKQVYYPLLEIAVGYAIQYLVTDTAESMIKEADRRMYENKISRKGR